MQKRVEISEALARKYPEQVVLVTTRSAEGKQNVMAVGWVAVASSEPLMFVLGIDDEACTYELIRQAQEFVVAFPSERMAAETLFAGSHHGHNRDKLTEAGIRTEAATAVKAPLVADAVANFECVLVEITRPGDCPLIVGKVVAAHANPDASLRRLYALGEGQGESLGGLRPA